MKKQNGGRRGGAGENGGTQADARDRILDAAEELFIQRGYDGVSINDVARGAGAAKGLIFYYFKNKEDLFDSVMDRYYAQHSRAIIEGFSGGGASTRERIHSVIDAYIDVLESNPGYPKLVQREVCSSSRGLVKTVEHMTPIYRWGLDALGGALPATGPLSAEHFFISIFGMIINYFTYTPLLDSLMEDDPLSEAKLAERRRHIHELVDAVVDRFLDA